MAPYQLKWAQNHGKDHERHLPTMQQAKTKTKNKK